MGQQITFHGIGLGQVRCLHPLPGYAPRELPDMRIRSFYTSMLNTHQVPGLTTKLGEPHILLQSPLNGLMRLYRKDL